MIGETVSHYTILEKLGEGGMGVVYKAQDTKLDRYVALKFLPPHLAASEQDKARFIQEAKSASALNHPNVCTIHDIQEFEKQMFIVMEFVDGQTLQEKKSSLTVKQAIDYGIQIAEGLAAAHEKGIIHRDIKPENIMIRKDGIVQVMDFGLAKLMGISRLTKAGSTVGTAGYMSPEQVQGHETDHRSDIFSFGVLLYEMIAAKSPFNGAHESAILYEIVNVDVQPPSTIKEGIEPELDRIVLECMEKDPNERMQSIKQVAIDLNRYKRTSSRTRLSRTFSTSNYSKSGVVPNDQSKGSNGSNGLSPYIVHMIWGTVVLLLLTLLLVKIFMINGNGAGEYPIQFSIAVPKGEMLELTTYGVLAVSPDGKTIAFVADGKLKKREIDNMKIVELPGTENAGSPFFSPDGKWLGYFAEGTIKKILLSGGPPIVIAKDLAQDNRGAVWTTNGTILYTPNVITGIWEISENGGTPRQITFVDSAKGERTHRWPSLLPDGKTVLFTVGTLNSPDFYDEATIDAANIATGERKEIIKNASTAKYVWNGFLAYTNYGTIYSIPFDVKGLSISGNPFPIIQGINGDPTSGAMAYDISHNGSLIYVEGENNGFANSLFRIDMNGKSTPLEIPSGAYIEPKMSPDGKKIAIVSTKAKDQDIAIFDIERKSFIRVTFGGLNRSPVWSPDGKKIAYYSRVESMFGKGVIVARNVDGSGSIDTLAATTSRHYLNSWSKDGQYIVMDVIGNSSDIEILNVKNDKKQWTYLQSPYDEFMATISPDGKNMAYISNESGMYQLYVQSFPERIGKWQISIDQAREPRWSPDGKKLYFSSKGKMMVVDVLKSVPFTSGAPRVQYEGDRRVSVDSGISYDISPDGSYFISLSSTSFALHSNVLVIVNWINELKKKHSHE